MDVVYWIIISVVFIIAFVGLIYPIIPSVLFLIAGYLLYGIFFSFEPFSIMFWIIQGMFVVLLFLADSISNLIGIKKFGGSKAGVWGSTIGLIAGPFVIPVMGILIGPVLGAVLAELLVNKTDWKSALKIGVGSLIGFLTSIITKGFVQIVMIVYFFFQIK